MSTFLIVFALLVALIGCFCLSQATMGVGLISAACFLAILARIAQANAQHWDIMKK